MSCALVALRRRRVLQAGLALAMLGSAPAAPGQPAPAALPRVVFIAAASAGTIAGRVDAFRAGLKGLGHVEGSTILVDYLYAGEKLDLIPALIADAMRRKPDVIVSAGPSITRALRAATGTVPIVMAFDPDPVGAGFVASLAQPGGNVTGLSSVGAQMGSKQLELLKQVMPRLRRATVIGNSGEPGNAPASQTLARDAKRLGVELTFADVRSPADIEPAFATALQSGSQAVLVLSSPMVTFHAARFAEQSLRQRLPAVFPYPDAVEAGGLMHYGVSMADLFRRAAGYVDRILRGAKPGELPVEQPSRFDLVLNLKAAQRLGIAVPADVLARADRIID
jgi:putative ABC transport system substrate-binding protein